MHLWPKLRKFGVLAAIVGTASLGGAAVFLSAAPSRPNIVFVLIYTLRADHMSLYGYERPTTPRLDEIAEDSVVFSRFYSVSNWTNPAIATLFTGYFPGAVFDEAPFKEAYRFPLPGQLTTLAEYLQAAGYRTQAFVANPVINARNGFGQGFHEFHFLGDPKADWRPVTKESVLAKLSDFLESCRQRPFFLYLHLVYPHQPYMSFPPFTTMFGPGFQKFHLQQRQGMINRYDSAIRYSDALVGDLYEELRQMKLLSRTEFVVTSDHGEEFWEHGNWEHGRTFFEEVVRVPLVIRPAGGRRRLLVDTPVSSINLFSTVLEMAGVAAPTNQDGVSLSRFYQQTAPLVPALLFSENP